MEPATPSSVMGDSEAAGPRGGAEKDAGTPFLNLDRIDITDFLITSLFLPRGYIREPKNRHERRTNRALIRDWNGRPVLPDHFTIKHTWSS